MIGQLTFFHGGIIPRDNKERTLFQPIKNTALPSVAIVPLLQHSGEEAVPLVRIGDLVAEYSCIAESRALSGVRIHAPIPGVVTDFRTITLPDGRDCRAIVIELSGTFSRSGKEAQVHDWASLDPARLIGLVREFGVVGMGPDASPTHLKLAVPKDKPPRLLVINGMESEPYQTADARLMIERAEAVIEGTRIIRYITGAHTSVIAVNDKQDTVVESLKRHAGKRSVEIRVQPLNPKYPQGDERLLVQALMGRDITPGVRIIDAGAIVFNIATVCAVYDAIVYRRALTERIVTVAGDAVVNPMNVKVKIGTPISWVLEDCGGLNTIPDRIVFGGPMLGHTVRDLDSPITKQTSMILAMTQNQIAYAPSRPCIRCGICVQSCPIGLEPQRLVRLIEASRIDQAVAEGLMECSECGICSYSCPSRVPLVEKLRIAKNRIRERQ